MKCKESRPYLRFLQEYAFKKKLLPSYMLTITMIVLTAGVSLVRPELQGKVIDDLGNPHSTSLSAFMILLSHICCYFFRYDSHNITLYIIHKIIQQICDKR